MGSEMCIRDRAKSTPITTTGMSFFLLFYFNNAAKNSTLFEYKGVSSVTIVYWLHIRLIFSGIFDLVRQIDEVRISFIHFNYCVIKYFSLRLGD